MKKQYEHGVHKLGTDFISVIDFIFSRVSLLALVMHSHHVYVDSDSDISGVHAASIFRVINNCKHIDRVKLEVILKKCNVFGTLSVDIIKKLPL
jgi:hypothetical protein